MGTLRAGRQLAALALAIAVAGCAFAPAAPREGAVRVTPIERARWDLPPEPGLFRVAFDAAVSAEIRRRTVATVAAEDIDIHYAEIRVLENEADRELKARGLCSGTTAFLGPLVGGDGQGAMSAIFKCRPTIF
ncbi:MAG: hypothetical protein IPH30_09315 [Betaproteobacteria bacterium]|jgi:hypothetical protein|nr:hypothetical protein [Betaproteobacteria bacterium]